jgi:PAS domain S-box-containing protein
MTGEKPLRILHVDDEKNQLEFTKLFLEQIEKDVVVDSVSDPEEALKKQSEENYDCIVSDYKMMSMNGIELAQKVREKSDVPFILYTGQGSEEVAESAFSAGVDDYLRKETEPTHYQVLAKRIIQSVEKHRTEELYRKVVEESRDAIIIVVDEKVAFMNKEAYSLFGIEKVEDSIGKNVIEFFNVETRKIFDLKKIDKGNYVIDILLNTDYGASRNAEISISQINYRGDKAYLCFIRDITERKKNEGRLNAIYQQAIKLGSALTPREISDITLDIMESVFVNQNISFHFVDGNSLKTLGTRGVFSIELVIPMSSPNIITKAARDGKSILVSDVSKSRDVHQGSDDSRSLLVVPAVLDGEAVSVLNVESDVKNSFTENDIKVLEMLAYHVAFAFNIIKTEALKRKDGEEKRKMFNYALGVLDNTEKASNLVSKELQRSILSILNATDFLRFQPDMLTEIIDTIDEKAEEAQNISELIREIIVQSKVLNGFIEINQALRSILEKSSIPKNIWIKTQYDNGLLIVEIEEEKFNRIMENLIINAIEAMPHGGSLSVRVTGRENEAFIDIIDSGPGISQNILENLFKPFVSTKDGHSGLGLAFCKNAVELVGGTLRLKSTSEKGTTFRLSLPLKIIV